MSKIAIAGDWHIDTDWALKMLELLFQEGVTEVYHVGDFGFDSTPTGIAYLDKINALCIRLGMTVYVTPGNHENYPFMEYEFGYESKDGFKSSSKWGRVKVIPRGARWSVNGVTFVSLGGANSINYNSLTPNVDWWDSERISLGDVYRTVSGGYADVMITHDAPVSLPIESSSTDWSAKDIEYACKSRYSVEEAVVAVRPSVLFHGHHHSYHDKNVVISSGLDSYEQRVVGLDMNGHPNNIAIMNMSDMSVTMLKY